METSPEEVGELLTLSAVSRKTGIPKSTLRRYQKRYPKDIPSVVRGRERRYPDEAVAAFEKIRKESPRRSGKKAPAKAGGRPEAEEENEIAARDEWNDPIHPESWRSIGPFSDANGLDQQVKKKGVRYFEELKRIVQDSKESSERRYRAMGWLLALREYGRNPDWEPPPAADLIKLFADVATSAPAEPRNQVRLDALGALLRVRLDRSRGPAGDKEPPGLTELLEIAEKGKTDELYRDAVITLTDLERAPVGPLPERAVRALAGGLLRLPSPEDRRRVANQLSRLRETSWKQKADIFIELLEKGHMERARLDAPAVIDAIVSEHEGWRGRARELTDYLIEKARKQNKRVSGNLAKLIVEAEGGNPERANDRIEEYQNLHEIAARELEELRVQVGGKRLTDALHDRDDYFSTFTRTLNSTTTSAWQDTIEKAREGFKYRLYMSGAVFIVGLLLVILFGTKLLLEVTRTGDALPYAALIPFLSGLGVMVLVTYTGPMKEIRQSVNDLGTASAAFIAYVHRVLQTSHTFSYYYLTRKITFKELKQASDIIGTAMEGTVEALNKKATDSSQETILGALEEVRKLALETRTSTGSGDQAGKDKAAPEAGKEGSPQG